MEPNINNENASNNQLTENSQPYVFHSKSGLNYTNNIENPDNFQYVNYKKKMINIPGTIALCLSLVLVVVILFCLIIAIATGWDVDSGAIWWLAIAYCWIAEVPITIASIIFGIIGLKSENKIPSYASFVVNSLKVVFLLLMH